MTATQSIAEFIVQTDSTVISPTARCAATYLLLDTFGVALAGRNAAGLPELRALHRRWHADGPALLLASNEGFPPPVAALINGAQIHALDLDDIYLLASLHLMSTILPAALACGQAQGCSGRELLDAMVVGVEVACRLGLACEGRWDPAFRSAFLQTTIIGGFGATAAACRLLKLNTKQITHALGLYHARNAGNRQALYDMTLAKRMQPGYAAQAAVESAYQAEAGITGPRRALEGDAGLQRLYMNATSALPPGWLSVAPSPWEIERVSIKQYSSCGACHALTHAAIELARRNLFAPEDIQAVHIYLGEGGNAMVGQPYVPGENPQVDAQFSAAYSVALGLQRRRADLSVYTDESVRNDREVSRLAQSVEILQHLAPSPRPARHGDGMPSFVDQPHLLLVRTADGQEYRISATLREVLPFVGQCEALVMEKFRACMAFAGWTDSEAVDVLRRSLLSVEEARSLEDLFAHTHSPIKENSHGHDGTHCGTDRTL